MIGFDGLGRNGLLGNQMFQYAALRGIAAKHNYEWCIPPNNVRSSSLQHQLELFETFNLKSVKNIQYVPEYYPLIMESNFDFNNELFSCCPDNINLGGYFQTEKYFKHIKKEIKKDFEFKSNIIEPCEKIIKTFGPCICLHIRRNDYVSMNQFLGIDYYIKGLEYFKDEMKVLIFSDDRQWCREQELFQSDRFFISPFNKFVDLCLMTLCSGHIIANSTLSWWGAWLSNSNTIIAPQKWMEENRKDIIPNDWIKI